MTEYFAIGKLLKAGYTTESVGRKVVATRPGFKTVELRLDADYDVATIFVRNNEQSDSREDYTAGSFFKSLSQAIKEATRQVESEVR